MRMTAMSHPDGPDTAQAKSRLLHRSLQEIPSVAVSGHGIWLVMKDGREILDASGGAAVSCLGHQHPRLIEALARQAANLTYAHTGFFSSEPAEALGEELVGDEPGGLAYAYLVSGGSEAVEASLKLARQYFVEIGQSQRTRFIARRQSYHGNTLGALAAGGNAWRRAPYAPILSDAFSHVSPAFAYREARDGEGEAEFVARLANELEAEFARLGQRWSLPSSPNPSSARPWGAFQPLRGIFAPCATSAIAMARC
jgi:adenosylmethionine-8-amino-7-oxononanoate aminotransferase